MPTMSETWPWWFVNNAKQKAVAQVEKENKYLDDQITYRCSYLRSVNPDDWQEIKADSVLDAATLYSTHIIPQPNLIYVLFPEDKLGETPPLTVTLKKAYKNENRRIYHKIGYLADPQKAPK